MANPNRGRVAVRTLPGECLAMAGGTPAPMAAPPGERVLEERSVESPVQNLDVIAIQGWADMLTSQAPIGAETPTAP